MNMKRLNYTLKLYALSPMTVSALLLGGLATLLGTDPAMRPETIVNFLLMASAFISVSLISPLFKPEELSGWELHATLPSPYWISVAEKVLINWLIINIVGGLTILFVMIGKGDYESALFSRAIAAMTVNTCVLGGIALYSTVSARNSKIGQLTALLVFVLCILNPFRDFLTFLAPFNISTASIGWWLGRFVYGFGGIIMIAASLRLMQNTNYLIEGGQRRMLPLFTSRSRKLKPFNKWIIALSSLTTLPTSMKMKGTIGYEALLVFLDGVIPILVFIMCIVFGIMLSLAEFFTHPGLNIISFFDDLAINSPRALSYFLLPILPAFLASRISQDIESKVDQLVLAATTAQNYLASKVLGVNVAIIFSLLISDIPVILILSLSALSGQVIYLTAHICILLFSLLPALFYWSTLSILLGTLMKPRHSRAIGGLIACVYVILFASTFNSVVGNILFPTGTMALETIAAWSRQHSGIVYSSVVPIKTVVPFYFLLLPFLSIGVQSALIGISSIKMFERRFHS